MLALVLLAAPALAQTPTWGWPHRLGGGAHDSVSDIGDATLDVVATYRLQASPEERITTMVSTPYGPIGFVSIPVAPTTICQLFRISDVATGRFERFGPTVACPDGGRVLAYDAPRDQLIVNVDGRATDAVLRGWNARTGEVRWEIGPAVVAEASGAQDRYDWFTGDIALDTELGIGYVIFALDDVGRHRIQAISLEDGSTIWATSIPADAPTRALTGPLAPDPAAQPVFDAALGNVSAAMELVQITLTMDGLVVSGGISPNGVQYEPVYAWLDLNGRTIGAVSGDATSEASGGGDGRAFRYSLAATAGGAQAAFVLSDRLYLVDPANQQPSRIDLPTDLGLVAYAPPAWSREALIVPLSTVAIVYPAADTASPRLWPGFEGSLIAQVVLAPPSDAYVLVRRATGSGFVGDLLRVDLATARTIDRLPIPLPPEDILGGVTLLPIGEGRLLAWAGGGGAVLYDESPESLRPRIELDNPFPAAGQALSLRAEVTGVMDDLTVAWGDGILDRTTPGTMISHAYESPGRRVLRVVAHYPDNRTGTAEAIVNVGGEPPQELNLMQKAFAPDNQNITFGVIGLAATGIGGLFAYGSRLRRKSRLQTDMLELERLRQLGKNEPYRAARELAGYRTRLQKDLQAGALDDAQFTALSSEALRLLGTLRLRLVGGLEGRASPRFRHQLETALEDGSVTPEELAALRETLATETSLTAADRARLTTLLEGWTAERTS